MFNVNEPVIPTLPVNVCVFDTEFPNIFDPLEYTTEEVIVCTTNVCAVIVLVDVILPDTLSDPDNTVLPIVVAEPLTINDPDNLVPPITSTPAAVAASKITLSAYNLVCAPCTNILPLLPPVPVYI